MIRVRNAVDGLQDLRDDLVGTDEDCVLAAQRL
jgi:hypothetical protein